MIVEYCHAVQLPENSDINNDIYDFGAIIGWHDQDEEEFNKYKCLTNKYQAIVSEPHYIILNDSKYHQICYVPQSMSIIKRFYC